jgi:hypothetical protein
MLEEVLMTHPLEAEVALALSVVMHLAVTAELVVLVQHHLLLVHQSLAQAVVEVVHTHQQLQQAEVVAEELVVVQQLWLFQELLIQVQVVVDVVKQTLVKPTQVVQVL